MKGVSQHPGFDAMVHHGTHGGGKKSKGNPIHLNPAHKGLLHEDLHIAQGKPIPETALKKAEHSKDPAERKRAFFADTARHKFQHK